MQEDTEYILTDESELMEEELEKELTEEEKRMFRYFIEHNPEKKVLKIYPGNGNCITLHGAEDVKHFIQFIQDYNHKVFET